MKQKYVLKINKDYLNNPNCSNIREFRTFKEMQTFQTGVIVGLAIDSEKSRLWDLWDFEIKEGEVDNEKYYKTA